LRQASIFSIIKQIKFLPFALMLVIAGCSLEKQSGFNRSLQNLTAHYNILFNAKELLRQKQGTYAQSFIDNYNEILSVYQDTIAKPANPDKDLEEAIAKANTIINVKEQSHYLGDAYLVLGKANYLEGNYFNAGEYFSYVLRSYSTRPDLKQEALVWKARSLMHLDQLPDAKITLDTAIQNINAKKRNPADVYAAKLQYDINTQDYIDGEKMAQQAIAYIHNKGQRLRLTFILGQLQELNQQPAEAIKNYALIAKSNASFEMAFNASLNRIRIEDNQNGIKTSRKERLLVLLKDPNNNEFKDQIYFQAAELDMAQKDIDNALMNYKRSLRYSIKNQNQKGLSYLRLAGIYFKNKADFLSAKKYYDSTLTTLPANYPGYQGIQKLGNNLQLLTDRLLTISREDTLQSLARMDEKTRLAIIDKMVADRTLQQQAAVNSPAINAGAGNADIPGGIISGSNFYFYNAAAISQGYVDFKRKWGNRRLEDNWRRSDRTNVDLSSNTAVILKNADPDAPAFSPVQSGGPVSAGNYRQELLQGLPLNPAMMSQSNLRIYNAYVDIGNFYRDVLADKKEAIANYEFIMRRYPDDPNKPAIYYNLYRLYSDVDPAKSDQYKYLLLKNYAQTPYAQIISDPNYLKKLDDVNAEFTQAYNVVFDLYGHKQYKEVLVCVPELIKQYPGNKFLAQLYYLQALAAGHNEGLIPFRDSLQGIAKRFPDDKLISPLVNQHLAYININEAELKARKVVLTDDDPNQVPFAFTPALQQQTEYRPPYVPESAGTNRDIKAPSTQAPVVTKQELKTPEKKGESVTKSAQVANNHAATVQPAVKQPEAPSIFSMADSTNYYFVVNISTPTINLSSSRFGIGQFDRANYPGIGIRHQLLPLGSDAQLIYVGRFTTIEGVKKYAREIIPLMPEIMKVPKDKYSFFIITKENLDKLADQKTLDSYIDYYQKNY
jgi:tetratricopeptide (TPR) repeat protein